MSDQSTSIAPALEALASAFEADPDAVYALVCNRVPCNEALADHPTVVVGESVVVGGGFHVGALGLINGVLEPLTGKRVAVEFSDEADEEGRRTIVGFRVYDPATGRTE